MGFVEGDMKRISSAIVDGYADVVPFDRMYNFDYLRERVGNFDREDIVPAFLGLERAIDELRAVKGTALLSELKERLDNLIETIENLRSLAMKELATARTVLSTSEPPPHR
jgi:hypothetical protein